MASRHFRLDMTMMYVAHDAFRRELRRLAQIASGTGDDPRRILSVAAGWKMFKDYLRVHHTSEDDALWPALRAVPSGSQEDRALIAAMEAEHAAIDPMLAAIDEALADLETGPRRLGDLVDGLAGTLNGHLGHEEKECLPLIDRTLSEQQWQSFSEIHRQRIGAQVSQYLPWLLDGVSDDAAAAILARLPEPARAAYRNAWRDAYAQLDLWGDGDGRGGD